MASHHAAGSPVRHVAVFPPQNADGCFLEIWPDAKPTHRDYFRDTAETAPSIHSREEEDPERWDGMS